MTETPNLHLKKADLTEPADIRIYNEDMDLLDAACATLQDGLETANTELWNKANVSQLHSAQILGNWDFRNPINQKGKSTYVNSGYTVDRWILHTTNGTSGKIEIFDGFVRVTKTEAMETILLQLIENHKALLGKQACLSLQTPDKIFTDTITIPSVTGVSKQMAIGNSGFFVDVYFTGTALQFRIGNPRGEIGNYVDIVTAKLELGHVSTLINDPPPHPATELARCQRYYQSKFTGRVNGVAISANFALLYCPLWVPMRTSPAVSIDANLSECLHDFKRATTITPALITEYTRTPFGVVLKAEGTFIENNPLYLVRDVIHIDANL